LGWLVVQLHLFQARKLSMRLPIDCWRIKRI